MTKEQKDKWTKGQGTNGQTDKGTNGTKGLNH